MMNSRVHTHSFASQSELIARLSESIAKDLQEVIEKNGKASLIVSGGSTPKGLFERLSRSEIEWEKVTVGLCDERWVPSSHEQSNEKLVRTHLLRERAAKARFVGLYREKMSAEEAEEACSQSIKEKLWPFDILVLGMGNDAHTASLFPENEKLQKAFDLEREELCIAIKPDNAPHMRMSLTRRAILGAKHLYLHFEGKQKLDVFEEAMQGEDMYTMPIRSILHQETTDVEVYLHA